MEILSLDEIFSDDPMGLLEVREKPKPLTSDERLIGSFEEILRFFLEHGREPEPDPAKINEYLLYERLVGLKSDPEKVKQLSPIDEFGLLGGVPEDIDTLLEQDDMGLLDGGEELFELKHVPAVYNPTDYKAKRMPSKEFEQYDLMFKECHREILNEVRMMKPFREIRQIKKGRYFVQSGVMLFVNEVGERFVKGGAPNARLHVVYENGTESDILLRSLAAALYTDGKLITEKNENLLAPLQGIEEQDAESGYIYVLKSLSEDPAVQEIPNLYKIGFSRGPVKERIKNAEKDPTYLMAPVEVVAEYKAFNMNVHKFETLLHRFFAEARIDAEVVNIEGFKNSANEWFSVSLNVIDSAIELLISGEIPNYSYSVHESGINPNK